MRKLLKDIPYLQSLGVFEVAARHLSFTRAARELGTTQSAVSHLIRRLENQLGVQLFQRIYRGVVLTPDGQTLLTAVQSGLGTIAEAVDRIRSPQRHRLINVATDFGFAGFWLLPRLAALRAQFPDLDVRIVTAQKAFDLDREPIDVAIVFGTGEHRHATATRLFAEEVFPVCSPHYLEGRTIRTAGDLVAAQLLHLDDEGEERWFSWETWLGAAGIDAPLARTLNFNNYTLLVQAAIAGQGIGLGWASLVEHLLAMGQLVRALDLSFTSSRGYFVLLPTDRPVRAEGLAFRDWLLSEQAGRAAAD